MSGTAPGAGETPKRANRRLALRMVAVVGGMFAFGFALSPLYDVLCRVTGLNGKTANAAVDPAAYVADAARQVNVEFTASVNGQKRWEFTPAVVRMPVHPGEVMETTFRAVNGSGRPAVIQAVPSVAPGRAAEYLKKVECFCFEKQAFEAGEARDMKVRFVVEPALPEDVGTLTLAYTLFELEEAR